MLDSSLAGLETSLTGVTSPDESEPDESRQNCHRHHQLLEAYRKRAPCGNQVYEILVDNWPIYMPATERGLLANRSRLSQHMQANGHFVVSLFRCIYSMAKFILCSTVCYCRDQAAKLLLQATPTPSN